MTTPRRDPEALLSAYLADGMEVLPDWVVDAVLDEVHRTRQQARFGPWRTRPVSWRIPTMNSYAKLAIAAVVVVVVAIGGLALLRPGESSGPGGAPTATPSPTPSPSAAPSASPAASPSPISMTDWVRFTSDRYGYTISYPPSHTGMPGSTVNASTFVAQAKRDFAFGTDTFAAAFENVPAIRTDRFEAYMENSPLDWIVFGPDCCQIGFWGFAATIPAGTSVDNVISQSRGTPPLHVNRSPSRSTVSRGDSSSVMTHSIAVVIVGDRAYVFHQGRGRSQRTS